MFHSTETALLRVHNDIALALDKKKMVVLLLLDLSAAFDTICPSSAAQTSGRLIWNSFSCAELDTLICNKSNAVRYS